MGGKVVVWCLSVFVLFFMIADGFVVKRKLPEENSSVEKTKDKNELDIVIRLVGIENLHNSYNLATPSKTDNNTICDTTDKEYKFFNSTQSCYKVHTEKATWPVAELTCIREGGQLAVVNSDDEAWVLVERYPSGFRVVHIGVLQIQGSWKTIDGKTLREAGYENWYEGEPSNLSGDQTCGSMYNDSSFAGISCSDETAFICEKAPISQSQPASTSEPQKTESDYKFIASTNSYYKVHAEKMTWDAAISTCMYEDAHLAIIHNQDEADHFKADFPIGSYQVFMGFHKKDNSWVTFEGQTLAEAGYERWNAGEPNDAYGGQDCGSMYPGGTFDDVSCFMQLAFICQKKSSPDTSSDSDSVDASSGAVKIPKCKTTATGYTFYDSTWSCYKVHTERATWIDAKATCVREGGHLAVINSQHEADVLTTMYPEGAVHVFVGFSCKDQRGSGFVSDSREGEWSAWLTIDGRTLQEAGYENWSPGEPNNAGGKEYCGTIYENGKFDDSDCYNKFDFICEVKAGNSDTYGY